MDLENIIYFFPKLKRRILLWKKRFGKYYDISNFSLKGYRPFPTNNSFKIRLHSMLGVYDSNILSRISHEERSAIMVSADRILRHEFNFLGSGPVLLEPIDWHVDFKTSYRWEKVFYLDIGNVDNADIKIPWELSRCQHLLWLGEAYIMTKEAKYAQEVIDEINWWIDDNPFMYSVNWVCAMDVAIRAVHWIFALNFITGYDGFSDLFVNKVTKSLWQHGFFINNNLEKAIPYSNNHYFSDLVGLLYIGELFSDTPTGRKWRNVSLKEYYSEVRSQILPSGVHYERSVSYHRLMTELVSYPVYMLSRTGEVIPEDIMNKVKKMYEYIANYTKPDGYSPVVADSDNGRLLPFKERDFREHSYLNNSLSIENRFITYGIGPLFISNNIESRLYEDAGVAILRSESIYLFINAGGYSGKPSKDKHVFLTHTHNDSLSYELCWGGKSIIIDPGTYLYTPSFSKRDEFRSTRKHNTILVDDEEQNFLIDAFQIKRNIKHKRLVLTDGYSSEGEYQTINGGMTHLRCFVLEERGLSIKDVLNKRGKNHHAKLFMHFNEGLTPMIKNDTIILESLMNISFNVPSYKMMIYNDTIAPSYGQLIPSKTAMIEFVFDERIEIQSFLKFL